MRIRKSICPIDYSKLCRQTVTVYHRTPDGITRSVHKRAFLDHKKTHSVEKTGSKEANSFLLVVPGEEQLVFVEDKVFDGVGPEISTADQWRDFIPVKHPGLFVVKYADAKRWGGSIVHTEAGG